MVPFNLKGRLNEDFFPVTLLCCLNHSMYCFLLYVNMWICYMNFKSFLLNFFSFLLQVSYWSQTFTISSLFYNSKCEILMMLERQQEQLVHKLRSSCFFPLEHEISCHPSQPRHYFVKKKQLFPQNCDFYITHYCWQLEPIKFFFWRGSLLIDLQFVTSVYRPSREIIQDICIN